MERAIDIWIRRAEDTWLKLLHSHAEELFRQSFLPSHDQHHHRRVWNISRELIRDLDANHSPLDQSLVNGVLLAVYFHDLGMIQSVQNDHGRLGREICLNFFSERNLETPQRFEEILQAVELHDLKGEGVYRGLFPGIAPDILSILSVADDLDALGIIGIYRYTEIYLKRGISLLDLGNEVLGNVRLRFNNILENCTINSNLIKRYQGHYSELVMFFERYNLQLPGEHEPLEVLSGPLGAVNHIRRMSVEGKTPPGNFSEDAELYDSDRFVRDFFRNLSDELQRDLHSTGYRSDSRTV